jgi:hypothetical protein
VEVLKKATENLAFNIESIHPKFEPRASKTRNLYLCHRTDVLGLAMAG